MDTGADEMVQYKPKANQAQLTSANTVDTLGMKKSSATSGRRLKPKASSYSNLRISCQAGLGEAEEHVGDGEDKAKGKSSRNGDK